MVSSIENEIDNVLLYLQDLTKEINYLQENYNGLIGIKNREYFHEVLYEDYFEVYLNVLELIRITENYSKEINSGDLKKGLESIACHLNNFDKFFPE